MKILVLINVYLKNSLFYRLKEGMINSIVANKTYMIHKIDHVNIDTDNICF